MSIIQGQTASDLLSSWLSYEKRHAHAMETVGRIPGGKSYRWHVGPAGWCLNLSDSGSSPEEIGDRELDEVVRAIESGTFVISGFDLQMCLSIHLHGDDARVVELRPDQKEHLLVMSR